MSSSEILKTNKSDKDRNRDTDYWSETNWRNFCGSTTMHGWYFLVDESLAKNKKLARLIRFLWAIIIVVSTSAALLLISYLLVNYRDDKTTTKYGLQRLVKTTTFFPALTVCNKNLARASALKATTGYDLSREELVPFLDFIYRGEDETAFIPELVKIVLGDNGTLEDLFPNETEREELYRISEDMKREGVKIWHFYQTGDDVNHVINSEESYSSVNLEIEKKPNTLDYYRLMALQRLSQSMYLRASFDKQHLKTRHFAMLHPFFDTDFGYCSYIRPQILFNHEYLDKGIPYEELLQFEKYVVHPGMPLGRKRGLYFLLDLEVFDYGESTAQSDGIRIGMHHPLHFPIAKLATVDARPGHHTTVGLDLKVTTTTDHVVDTYSEESRSCNSQNEFKFTNLPNKAFRYSFDNCLSEAVFERVVTKCGCRRAIGRLQDVLRNDLASDQIGGREDLLKNFETVGRQDQVGRFMRSTETFDGCYGAKLTCYMKMWRNFGETQEVKDLDKLNRVCRAACNGASYRVQGVSTTRFPSYNALTTDPVLYCLVFRKLYAICKHIDEDFGENNVYDKRRAELLERFFNFTYSEPELIKNMRQKLWNSTEERERKLADFAYCHTINEEIRRHGVCVNFNENDPMVMEEFLHDAREELRNISSRFLSGSEKGTEPADDDKEVDIVVTDGFKISIRRKVREIVFHYSRTNLASVLIMMGSLDTRQTTRTETRPFLWIFADIGGIMGLTTGCSVVTFVEIAFFIWKYFMYVRYRYEKRRDEDIKEKKAEELRKAKSVTEGKKETD